MATLYVVMYMANNNEKYKIFVRDFESETISDKVMFYVLGVLYSYLTNPSKDVWTNPATQDEIKDAFKNNDWTNVDWSFNYINQIFWTISMKGLDMKRSFLKSYLRFGFPSIAVIVSSNLNKHMETSNDLIDFILTVCIILDNGLINIDDEM